MAYAVDFGRFRPIRYRFHPMNLNCLSPRIPGDTSCDTFGYPAILQTVKTLVFVLSNCVHTSDTVPNGNKKSSITNFTITTVTFAIVKLVIGRSDRFGSRLCAQNSDMPLKPASAHVYARLYRFGGGLYIYEAIQSYTRYQGTLCMNVCHFHPAIKAG